MFETLLTSLEENTMVITINRPDKLNAINETVMTELGIVMDDILGNDEVKSAIITGSGNKAFVAGADITEFNGIREEGTAMSKKGQAIFRKIELSAKPIIAAINGYALGAGCELAMSCHFRIASSNAKFGQPEVNLGLLPGYGGTQRLVQLIGKGRAMELLLTAKSIDAATALQWGLVNAVTAPEELLARTKEIISLVNTKAPLALAATIKAVNAVFDEKIEGFSYEAELFGECYATDDLKEGRDAFLNKRKANFTGK